MQQMTFLKFLTHAGLWLDGESAGDKMRQIRDLTPEDREWFKERAKIELGIEIT